MSTGKLAEHYEKTGRKDPKNLLEASPEKLIRGPRWSPPPMGFGIGILITGGNLYGGGTQDTDFNKEIIGFFL